MLGCDLWGKCEAAVVLFGPWRVCRMHLRGLRGREWLGIGVDIDEHRRGFNILDRFRQQNAPPE